MLLLYIITFNDTYSNPNLKSTFFSMNKNHVPVCAIAKMCNLYPYTKKMYTKLFSSTFERVVKMENV